MTADLETRPDRARESRRRAWLAALIVVTTLAVYLPAIEGGFVWDDDDYVTENDTLRSADGLRRIWLEIGAVPQYYPLVHTTFWLEYRLWGLEPLGYHLVNVLLHALNALLAWRLLARLGLRAAWPAALLFAVHPLHVESVAWITERKNVLSAALYLAAALAYLCARPLSGREANRSTRTGGYLVSLLLFTGALLSKTVTASLPAALAVATWWKRGRLGRRELLLLAPMVVLGLVLGLVTVWTERHHVGAAGAAWEIPFARRIVIAGRALGFYLGRLFWPHPLTFIYPRWSPEELSGIFWLFPAGAALVLAALWALRHRIGRGPLAAGLFYAGTLFPALGLFNVYPMRFSFVADHFAYLASLGPLALAAGLACGLAEAGGAAGRRVAIATLAVVVVALGALTWRQGRIYVDEETLWRDTIAKNPQAFIAHNNLGAIQLERGDLASAERHLEAATRITRDPEALDNLGIVRDRQGRHAEALELYREALQSDPEFADAHNNLGTSLAAQGRIEEALPHFAEAVRIRPAFARARYNLGIALSATGRVDAALEQLDQAVRLEPSDADARLALGSVLQQLGRFEPAIAAYDATLRLRPGWPTAAARLAFLLAAAPDPELRDSRRAVGLAAEACRATANGDIRALDALGAALAEAGRFQDALGPVARAVEIARRGGQGPLARELESRLEGYRQGRAHRIPQPRPDGGSERASPLRP